MKATRKTKRSLLASALALVLCFAMLLGATFAWFTDSVTSEGNKIESGNLKIDLSHKVGEDWISVKDNPTHKIFDYDNWEPGYTTVETLKVENLGSLALQYKLSLALAEGTAVLGEHGENLADVIEVYVTYGERTPSSFAEIAESGEWTYKGTLAEAMVDPTAFLGGAIVPAGETPEETTATTTVGEQYLMIALHMQESAGNEYQELSVGDIFVNLIATQWSYENDSFDAEYDSEATFPNLAIDFTAAAVVEDKISDGVLTEELTVGDPEGEIYADVPANVAIAEGSSTVTLSVKTIEESEANVAVSEEGKSAMSLDVHMDGISSDNTVPMLITLRGLVKRGLNDNNIEFYHVENGQTVAMTLVPYSELDEHNEFSYDPATGDVVVAMASFSEVIALVDDRTIWDGTPAQSFSGGSGNENDPYVITTAAQLAYFRNEVDAGRTFEDEFVVLGASIDLCSVNFDPIGWGYDYAGYNRDGVAGKTFKGTFDGRNFTIYNLYQNGWDLETNGTDYTYTNCGFGLFASACDATIKNLFVSDANIVAECVEMGIVVGLAQGNCTFDNITIENSKIANYQRPAGGVVGEVSPKYENGSWVGTCNFNKITLYDDVVVGSLWGDFDTPVGGVIGARWDDANTTTVNITDSVIACRLDVYNDVTATYQWYAYRRAGMLIGNTDTPPADGKNSKVATADFLTCDNVRVYYGDWVNYHYCEFTNYNSNWPFVRVEAGENCSAFSNPRYGVPNDAEGRQVVNMNHKHAEGDDCNVLLAFNQLYGGGQGVYGQAEHAGVTTANYKYCVTYMHNIHIEKVVFVTDNSVPYTLILPGDAVWGEDANSRDRWIDANGNTITAVPAGNTKEVVVYRDEAEVLVAYFLDNHGAVLYYKQFTQGQAELDYEPEVPQIIGYTGRWEPYDLAKATTSIIIKPMYTVASDFEILGTTITAKELFSKLQNGENVVMSQDMIRDPSGLTGGSNTFCTLDKVSATLNFNTYELTCQFDHNAAKPWRIFDIKNGGCLTLSSGINGEGALIMNLTNMNSNATACVFYMGTGGTLVLQKGLVIEIHYPAANNGKVQFFNDNVDLSAYQDTLKKDTVGNTTIRLTVLETTTITIK